MKIVVAVRCYNEIGNIERFLRQYDFADLIVISDGGSTDGSVEYLEGRSKIELHHYGNYEICYGHRWNPDAMHMNYVINRAKEHDPDWLILDDMDSVPNHLLRKDARTLLETCVLTQVNAFRLYMWGENEYFPFMNRDFHPDYRSLWAWKPKEIDIQADESIRHGTIVGTTSENCGIDIPYCLLHYSWHPRTIQAKVDRYNELGLPMQHPLEFAGSPKPVPDWATP